ncbi:MAG: ATP-binding protein [Deltaproteobacteria bacterium]|nr:ATP-binding protein [Deltaproteobacteria bacterium]
MISRYLTLPTDYSFFLFGPRGSGKSTLLRHIFKRKPSAVWLDLLDPEEEAIFQATPNELLKRIGHLKPKAWVIIDEVQKAPKLLDLVHKLIEEKDLLFALSGSSARKLKRGAANLLAGRAFMFHLHPFSFFELSSTLSLEEILQWGTLPKVTELKSPNAKKLFLQAYANTYLKEEIQVEQIVRNLPTFRRFLEMAAQMNSLPLNYSKIAQDIHTDHSVIRNYYEILIDTLIGFELPAYHQSLRKQQRLAPKFYFFDCGIKRALSKTLEIPLKERTYDYGRAFEHFIILEFFKLCQYRNKEETLSYLQTKDNVEIDLIMTRPGKSTLFIEIKSTSNITDKDFTSLNKIVPKHMNAQSFILSLDPKTKSKGNVRSFFWKDFLEKFKKDLIE